jgi:hypothetical protein|tara:strand:+ start:2492 stop:5122 length:2631 start_codon:yes stop_codon:yes gene_type:complete
MVTKVTDPDKIKELDEIRKKKLGINDNAITDEIKIKELDEIRLDKKEKNFLSGVGESIYEFFSGTKSTEFSDMPEIGEYVGEGAGKVALGMSITPNIRTQAQIIMEQIPGSNIMEDKFGNPIAVMPDGQSFYLNRPGASFQDFIQTTSQILQYIPGYSTIAKKYAGNILKRSLAQTGQAGVVTAAQEAGAVALGGDFDLGRVGITGAITLGFEGVLGPVGRGVLKMFRSNPNYYKLITETVDGEKVRRIEITPAGEKALKAAGINTEKMTPEFAENFFNQIAKGFDNEVAAVQAGAGDFGFELSQSQAKRNEEGIAALYEAAKGAFGPDVQKKALEFLRKQEIDIGLGLKAMIKKFNEGNVIEEGVEDIGQGLINTIEEAFDVASKKVDDAYNLVDKDAIFNGEASNIQLLTNSVKKTIKDETKQPYNFLKAIDEATGILDTKLTPASTQAFKEIKAFVNSFKKKKSQKKVPPKTLNDFEIMRKKLANFIGAAKNDTDKKTAIAIKQEFDKLYNDTMDNLLFAGKEGDEVIKNNLIKAREAFRYKEQTFKNNPIKKGNVTVQDTAGNAIQKILLDPDVTGMKAINYIYGLGTVGRKKDGAQIINRLKTVFGVDKLSPKAAALKNNDFAKLRGGMIEKMFNDSIRNGKFNPAAMVRNFDYIFEKNPDFARSLFDPTEITTLKNFVNEVRKTLKPADLVNPSNTAAGISRIFQRGARQLVGIIGFKLANIQGLLLGRSAFDNAKDVFEQRAAKKLINKEFGGDKPGWLQTMNQATGTGRKLASTVAIVNQAYGQNIPKGGIDAAQFSAVEEALPEPKSKEGVIKDIGPLPNPFKPKQDDRVSLPSPVRQGIEQLTAQNYDNLFPDDTLGAAIAQRRTV